MRKGFRTNLEEDLISKIKVRAIELGVDVNDIIEPLLEKYLDGEIQIQIKKK